MFWILWAIDALCAMVILSLFLAGLADGSVSSFNMGSWLLILVAVTGILGGSLWLRSAGRRRTAVVVLLLLALPGILATIVMLVLLLTSPHWN